MIFRLLRPALFAFEPEKGHLLALKSLSVLPHSNPAKSGKLAIDVAGLSFPNPVGIAAGFDKDAQVPDALLGLGYGFTEVGSLTPLPQPGNPRPRLFRLVRDRAVINRMGFNNGGAQAALQRLEARRDRDGIVGINIGANKASPDRIKDYVQMTELMAPYASYLAVNVSSPNTPGLRALQDESALADLLDHVLAARAALHLASAPPVFLKVAPDLEASDIDAISRLAVEKQLGGLIVSNTTIARPALQSLHAEEAGGLSGAPLRAIAVQRLRDFRKATGGAIPLIGVGGIGSAEDAWERIKAGASLVQLYSALVYEGLGLGARIVKGLERLMEREGFTSIAQAVGSE